MTGATMKPYNTPGVEGGEFGIYLGLTYKETKAVWRLAAGHTASRRKILGLDLGALTLGPA